MDCRPQTAVVCEAVARISKVLFAVALCLVTVQCGEEELVGPALSQRQMAFIGTSQGATDVYLVNADGTGLTNLTNAPAGYDELTWSPGGSGLAVTIGDSAILVVHTAGRMLDLTADVEAGTNPVWSPGGSRIAFEEGYWPDGDIYVMDAVSGGIVSFTSHSADEYAPRWSPDGTLLAFVRVFANLNSEIHVVPAAGGEAVNLTRNVSPDFWPRWSPDGSRIAFVSRRGGEGGVYVMRSDGSGLVKLTNENAQYTELEWSPDGSRIAFLKAPFDGGRDVLVADAAGTGRANISGGSAEEDCPAWSPDGSMIAYLSYATADYGEIHVVDMVRGGDVNLTGDGIADGCPVWSPDGAWLATVSLLEPNAPAVLTTMRPDGSGRMTVIDLEVRSPRWRP
jgi:TolB protein